MTYIYSRHNPAHADGLELVMRNNNQETVIPRKLIATVVMLLDNKLATKVFCIGVIKQWLNLGLREAKDIGDFIIDNMTAKPERGYDNCASAPADLREIAENEILTTKRQLELDQKSK